MNQPIVRKHTVAHSRYHRFAITVPERMAAQIDDICEIEGRSRSEFFREAVRIYLASRSREPQFLMPTSEEERKDNPFHTFAEWDSEADSIYDTLR
ncbi:ribbon-helix-helix CopG family protein [Nitrosospira sp. Nsp5]|uniref:Ribbon-helix-helix protein, copG family n=1 Tax=Nitrosospira multiformis TaxID=1231 RepID=A0ABY0T6P2_9PROT|nr:ribbon-helix-helix CopG family protein [Nitrosospira sp. Nsp5]SDQ34787.1 Ribbon-helix-helix protein, copG family [Nitrosospira multiformis]